MAKNRADKPRKGKTDKAKKREKKVSRDAVEKSTGDSKKPKRAVTPQSSEDDESDSDTSEVAPVVDTKAEKKAEKKEKKDKKKKKKSEKAEEEADATPLFTIDVNPTPVNPSDAAAASESEPEAEDGNANKTETRKSHNPPPSGLNRAARRRIMLIERQRETIQKKLGVPAGSQERADEVQKQLDDWMERYDAKAAIKAEKRRLRKQKEAARLKSKTGKALTGRRLKDRQKQIKTVEKAAKRKERQGLSKER